MTKKIKLWIPCFLFMTESLDSATSINFSCDSGGALKDAEPTIVLLLLILSKTCIIYKPFYTSHSAFLFCADRIIVCVNLELSFY